MSRPRIKIKKEIVDYVVEIISIASVILSFWITVFYWNKFPNNIVILINQSDGQVESFWSKWIVFIIPIISALTYIGISFFCKYPHIFNYPVELTEKNATKLYTIGIRTISFMKMTLCLLFLYISYAQVQSIVFHSNMSLFIILSFILIIALTPIYPIIKMVKLKS